MGPDRRPRIRGLHPLPLLDHFGVGLLDESPDPSERLAPPVTQLPNSRIDPLRGRASSRSVLRAALVLVHRAPRVGRSHSFAGQRARLLHPVGILSFVALAALVAVWVANFFLLGLARGRG